MRSAFRVRHLPALSLCLAAAPLFAQEAPPPAASAVHPPSPTIRYPRLAQENGEQGTVVIRFDVDKAGRIGNCIVEKGSGWPMLDKESCAQALRGQFRTPVDATGKLLSGRYRQSVRWELKAEALQERPDLKGVNVDPEHWFSPNLD